MSQQDLAHHPLSQAIRAEFDLRAADIAKGVVTAELAALLFDTVAQGMARAAVLFGFQFELLKPDLDRLVRSLDPRFDEHLQVRSTAIPVGLAYEARASLAPPRASSRTESLRCDILLAEDSQDSRDLWAAILN